MKLPEFYLGTVGSLEEVACSREGRQRGGDLGVITDDVGSVLHFLERKLVFVTALRGRESALSLR